jgi:glutathione-independent formaldehyde dehydrogenase
LDVPWGKIFGKGVRIGMGRDHDERYNDLLRDLIAARRIHPGTIVSHRLPLDDAPDAYRRFDERRDGYLKVVLDPTIAAT